jgi:SAM-dependent MidA family methyltransferase
MKALAEKIAAEIQAGGGSISFARFMEMALYEPGLGYYERREHSPGRQGDYFTSVSVGPLFGQMLARRLAGWLSELPATTDLCLVEAGAHDGRLAVDIIGFFREQLPSLGERLCYWMVEPSPTRTAWQRETVSRELGRAAPSQAGLAITSPGVRWAAGLSDLPKPLRGVIFSNELLDAFPVHRIGWDAQAQDWFEWRVTWRCARFDWAKGPRPASLEGMDLPQALLDVLPDGFSTELCPAAEAWWSEAAKQLDQGRLMAIDYGLAEEDFFAPHRAQGTLRGYRRHQLVHDVLEQPGLTDLTSQVNFTNLKRIGEKAGLITQINQNQAGFLAQIVKETPSLQSLSPGAMRQLLTLMHPEHLGNRFQVLVQQLV